MARTFERKIVVKGEDRSGPAFKSVSSGLDKIAKSAIGIGAGAFAVGALTARIEEAVTSFDKVAKTADKIDIATASLQELRFAADLSGVATAQMDKALADFTRRIGEAEAGTGQGKLEFERLGISIRDTNGQLKSTEVLFGEVADGLNKVRDQAVRARISYNLFGRAGVDLTNLTRKGAAAIAEMRKEARDLGLVIREDTLRETEAMNDELTKTNAIIDIQTKKLSLELAPAYITVKKAQAGLTEAFAKDIKGLTLGVLAGGALLKMATGNVAEFKKLEKRISKVTEVMGKLRDEQERLISSDLPPDALKRAQDDLDARIRVTTTLLEQLEKRQIAVGRFALQELGKPISKSPSSEQSRKDLGSAPDPVEEVETEADVRRREREEAAEARRIEMLERRTEDLVATIVGEEAQEQLSFERRRDQLREALDEEILTKSQFQIFEQELNTQHQDSLTQIEDDAAQKRIEASKKEREAKIKNSFATADSILSIAGSFGGKAFQQSKGFRIAEAFIDGARGVTRAFAENAFPIPAIPVAAAIAASTVAQISSIASAKPGSAGSLSIPGAGGGGTAAPSVPALSESDISGGGERGPRRIRITIDGLDDGALLTGATVRKLIDSLKEAQEDGDELILVGT